MHGATILVIVSSVWTLKQIYIKVCRILFWTSMSDLVLEICNDLLKQWECPPPEIQKQILGIFMNRIHQFKSSYWKALTTMQCDPATIIDD